MNRAEVTEKLNGIFRKNFEDDTLVITDTLTADDVEKWDSLSHIKLISTVENEFGIKFKLKELIAMKNVGDLINYIESKLTAK
jgi:acyl carrier protein